MTEEFDLIDVLPHKPPMILVDKIISYDVEKLKLSAEVSISKDTLFFDTVMGGVPAWVGIEYMAQTIGALSGVFGKKKNEEKPTMGFILGTRKYENKIGCFKEGKSYRIDVEELFYSSGLGCFKGIIKDKKENICASAELNVFRMENSDDFVNQVVKGKIDG